jgi:hypothetical protein
MISIFAPIAICQTLLAGAPCHTDDFGHGWWYLTKEQCVAAIAPLPTPEGKIKGCVRFDIEFVP